ncbi:MAG: hypothetical protein A2234_03650 [Elusimicrobia bacterium RIFOXYA2_FULL_58_8]|nr:MAG: hypothetical protein A2285_10285 [Elusimicrobia bacterium RIFOXYA12_FULL_57_11]OGS16523.1 MAG: hypothetical protein A2234_03650 [Elusimicrobia bacterium RIFOXYA2_FULL_58_8]
MKKTLLAVICSLFTATAYSGQELDASFPNFAKQLDSVCIAAQPSPSAVSAPEKTRAGHYARVSGYVTLNGSGFMPQGGGFTSVTLTGWATFRDSSGRITSSNAYVNVNASMWVKPNQSIFQSVYPTVYAQFNNNGKPAGSAALTGSISLSGWPTGSFFSVNGSGYLSGTIYVTDEE